MSSEEKMTLDKAVKIIENFLSLGYTKDGKPRTEKDKAILFLIDKAKGNDKANDNNRG